MNGLSGAVNSAGFCLRCSSPSQPDHGWHRSGAKAPDPAVHIGISAALDAFSRRPGLAAAASLLASSALARLRCIRIRAAVALACPLLLPAADGRAAAVLPPSISLRPGDPGQAVLTPPQFARSSTAHLPLASATSLPSRSRPCAQACDLFLQASSAPEHRSWLMLCAWRHWRCTLCRQTPHARLTTPASGTGRRILKHNRP